MGYGGDDILVVSDTAFKRIAGGAGEDTLLLSGSNNMLDFSAMVKGTVTGIEKLDIGGSGFNIVKLDIQNVLDMSEPTHTLLIDGGTDDLAFISGFTDTGTQAQVGAVNYEVDTGGAGATLWIDRDITTTVI